MWHPRRFFIFSANNGVFKSKTICTTVKQTIKLILYLAYVLRWFLFLQVFVFEGFSFSIFQKIILLQLAFPSWPLFTASGWAKLRLCLPWRFCIVLLLEVGFCQTFGTAALVICRSLQALFVWHYYHVNCQKLEAGKQQNCTNVKSKLNSHPKQLIDWNWLQHFGVKTWETGGWSEPIHQVTDLYRCFWFLRAAGKLHDW